MQGRTAELAEANASLRYEREMLRITLASIGDAVLATDLKGRVTFLNSVAQTLTGWGQDEDRRRSREAGFNHHLVKPVRHAELEKLLGELKATTA